MYDDGRGVSQDSVEAARWYRLAGNQGHAPARYRLGVMYELGHGVAQDHAEAAAWFRLAANQGHADAQLALGDLYADGRGVAQDDAAAYLWLSLGAEAVQDEKTRESSVVARDAVGERLTTDQRADAERRARAWMPTSSP